MPPTGGRENTIMNKSKMHANADQDDAPVMSDPQTETVTEQASTTDVVESEEATEDTIDE